jgi:hypothetical protein
LSCRVGSTFCSLLNQRNKKSLKHIWTKNIKRVFESIFCNWACHSPRLVNPTPQVPSIKQNTIPTISCPVYYVSWNHLMPHCILRLFYTHYQIQKGMKKNLNRSDQRKMIKLFVCHFSLERDAYFVADRCVLYSFLIEEFQLLGLFLLRFYLNGCRRRN